VIHDAAVAAIDAAGRTEMERARQPELTLDLTRARTFAMHAAGQVERSRLDYGRGRYTLWTGDLGTAL
jgi:hypothetical protein